MRDERQAEEVKTVWQNQPTEISAMTLKLIRSKARELHAKTRKKQLGTAAGPLAAGFLYVFAMREFPSLAPPLHALFACALAWSLLGLYFLNRGMWFAATPGDAALTAGLEFCRGEIARRRQLLDRLLLWSLGPALLALSAFILALASAGAHGRGLYPNGVPFLAVLALWFVGYFAMRVRERRELKREMDELVDLESHNRT